jgi:proline iminopeptidase
MKSLYPEIEPFQQFYLDYDPPHRVYVEQSGNPAAIPVIFLHGGPCSGTKPDHRRFFDPSRYHIILMDQRGCGRSEPFGELRNNTLQHLLDDLQQIRKQLRIEQWLLFGGSWGATLALSYAQRYPQHVAAMILRGSFLARQTDMHWFLLDGANRVYPQAWQKLLDSVGEQDARQLLPKLCAAVFGVDEAAALNAAAAWQAWGGQVALGNAYQADLAAESDAKALLQVRMELHYARNAYFLQEDQLLQHCALLQSIPAWIIHGRNDLTCPLEAGWRLHQALPQAEFQVLPNSGHIASGEEMIDALVSACDAAAELLETR